MRPPRPQTGTTQGLVLQCKFRDPLRLLAGIAHGNRPIAIAECAHRTLPRIDDCGRHPPCLENLDRTIHCVSLADRTEIENDTGD